MSLYSRTPLLPATSQTGSPNSSCLGLDSPPRIDNALPSPSPLESFGLMFKLAAARVQFEFSSVQGPPLPTEVLICALSPLEPGPWPLPRTPHISLPCSLLLPSLLSEVFFLFPFEIQSPVHILQIPGSFPLFCFDFLESLFGQE